MNSLWADAPVSAHTLVADLFSITAPRRVRRSDGSTHVMAECFPLATGQGLVYFELFWHLQRPATRAIHVLQGEVRGDGPWKVGDGIITILGCQGTDPDLAASYAEWQEYFQQGAPGYPADEVIHALARSVGAATD